MKRSRDQKSTDNAVFILSTEAKDYARYTSEAIPRQVIFAMEGLSYTDKQSIPIIVFKEACTINQLRRKFEPTKEMDAETRSLFRIISEDLDIIVQSLFEAGYLIKI